MPGGKAEKNRRDARRFGITVPDLIALKKEIRRIRLLQTGTPAAKRTAAARQLGISSAALGALERNLTHPGSVDETVKAAARRVISYRGIDSGPTKNAKGTSKRPAGSKAASGSTGQVNSPLTSGQMRRLKLDAAVFVTKWGSCVHTFHDCHGIQGFLPAGEPDRIVYQVTLRAPQCAGRRLCQICCNNWATSSRLYGDKLISDFHGSAPQIWPPPGQKVKPPPPPPPPPPEPPDSGIAKLNKILKEKGQNAPPVASRSAKRKPK